MVLTVFGAASNIGLTGYQSPLVVFLVREANLAPGAVGLLVAAMSLGGVVGAVLASRIGRRRGTARALLLAAAFTGPPALLVPLTDSGGRWMWAALGGSLPAGALAATLDTRTAVVAMTVWLAVSPLILLTGPLRHRRDLPVAAATP